MSRARLLRALACAITLGGSAVAIAGCDVGVGASFPVVVDGDYPAGCVATTDAVYYNGYASYYCGGLWYYRGEGGRWGHYDREPAELSNRRSQGAPGRRTYERSRPAGGGRPGGGGHR